MVSASLSKAIGEEGGVTALVLSDAEIIAAWRQETDLPSDGNEDIQPSFPVIKIVQPVSMMDGAVKHIGEFYHSDWDAYTPELECVALIRRDTRAFFQKGDSNPLCMSADGEAPLPGMRLWDANHENTPQPQLCDQCPFSTWIDENPPLCSKSMVVLVDRGAGDLAQLRLIGKSIRPYRQFVRSDCDRRISLCSLTG